MDGTRHALIVASDDYDDPGLRRLRAPAGDADRLAAVLRNPGIGDFAVRTLLNEPAHEISLAVEEFFADRQPDDLLLLHISCHGVKGEGGELYFAATNTRLRRLNATAVPAEFINRRMSRSQSQRIVLLLDCCYSGAFERGMTARAGADVGIEEQFGGRGRAVITASSAMEYAFEGSELADSGELVPSVFTGALVEGLESGEADHDQDGLVALDELYDYVYDKVRRATPNQTPGRWTFGATGALVIARRSHPVTTPAPLPPELQQAIDHGLAEVRAAAVQELTRVSRSRHAGLVLAAKLALERLANDDSRMVSAAAAAALGSLAQPILAGPPTPSLELSATTVEFGPLLQHGPSPERIIRLDNAGGGDLNARASTEASWLELGLVGDELVVGVETTAVGEYEGFVTVDSDGGSATIHVTASVDPAPSRDDQLPATAVGQPVTAGRPNLGDGQHHSSPSPSPPPAIPARRRPRQAGPPGLAGGSRGSSQSYRPTAGSRQRTRAAPRGSRRVRTSLKGGRGRLLWGATLVVATIVIFVGQLADNFELGGQLAAVLITLAAIANVALSMLGPRFNEQMREQNEREQLLLDQCKLLDHRSADLPLVGDRRNPLDFGVRKVALRAAAAEPQGLPRDWPLYVRRDVDEELDQALAGGGVVVLVGEAHVGKSRTAFEAMHRVCRDRLLLVPKWRESPRILADAGFTFPNTVVWLDDLEGYLAVNQLDQALDELFCQHADSVVLATMRSGEYALHSGESPSRNPGAQQSSGTATPGLFRSSNRLLGDMATVVPLSPHWSQDERGRAHDQARDPRIAEALQQSDTLELVGYMTSGPQLWKKWRDAWLGVQPVGAAIVAAAVDCRRIGRSRPVPADLLRRLHQAYVEDPEAASTPRAFEDGLAWASQGHALIKPVDDAGSQGYVAVDYLVDAVQRNQDSYPVPEATWRAVVDSLEPDEAWDVGTAAYRAQLPRIAERAFRVGTRATRVSVRGNAANGLANVLLDADEVAEAETWLKVAADAGVTAAIVNLGWLLERRGDRQQAEWYYRQAYRQGDIDAANNLGVLFAERGDDRAAEEWLSRAHQAGHPKATNNLGLLLGRRGDRDGARRLFRQAAALGNTEAEEHLRDLPPDGSP